MSNSELLKSDQGGIESYTLYMTDEQLGIVEIRPRWDWKGIDAPGTYRDYIKCWNQTKVGLKGSFLS